MTVRAPLATHASRARRPAYKHKPGQPLPTGMFHVKHEPTKDGGGAPISAGAGSPTAFQSPPDPPPSPLPGRSASCNNSGMRLDQHAQQALDALAEDGLLRAPPIVESDGTRHVTVNGEKLLSFSSNDYLGLANDPSVIREAASDPSLSAGAGASRLITGTQPIHLEAEAALAEFVGYPASRLFATGYAANVGVIPALVGRDDLIVADALNHASLIDGARLSRATIKVYDHGDVGMARDLLAAHRANFRNALLLTDALFSMDGDEAPLTALREVTSAYDTWMMVDEAHSLGVFGPGGAGLCTEQGVSPEVLIGTLGKAFGLAGAFAATSQPVQALLLNRARSFVFSTGPLPIQAAAIKLMTPRVRAADEARLKVLRHAHALRSALARSGWQTVEARSPIVPIIIGDSLVTLEIATHLRSRGVLAHPIRPPTVPSGTSRIRLVPTAAHTDDDIRTLLAAFDSALHLRNDG